MLRISEGLEHSLWPFSKLVDTHKLTGNKIAPNANKILKDLAGHSKSLGFNALSEIFRDAFDSDVRNGYSHADYIIWSDGLRLRKRNGGIPRKISWAEFALLFQRGINFFNVLQQVVSEYTQSYDPPKSIIGRLGNAPEMPWTIYFEPRAGAFGIISGKYPRE